jgi:hypothetical protein
MGQPQVLVRMAGAPSSAVRVLARGGHSQVLVRMAHPPSLSRAVQSWSGTCIHGIGHNLTEMPGLSCIRCHTRRVYSQGARAVAVADVTAKSGCSG